MTNEPMPNDTRSMRTDRGRSRRAILLAALTLIVVGAGAAWFFLAHEQEPARTAAAQKKILYTCPMHPQIIRDKPGECPICHMELVPLKSPGSVDSATGATSGATSGAARAVVLDAEGKITAHVATAEASYRMISAALTVPASVDFNEATHRIISARFGGRIDHLFVRETGQYVRAGDPLMDVYSPEIVTAQKDYLLALGMAPEGLQPAHALGGGLTAEAHDRRLVLAARKRLELLGVSSAQIAALEKDGEVTYETRVYAQASGVVLKRSVTEGAYVAEGAPLLELADLSSVWVIASVYESDAFRVGRGMAMTVSGPALGNRTLAGATEYVYPVVDAASRTVRVRGVFGNPATLLKPGMYVTATIRTATRDALVVPVGAVVRTGRRDLVYVETAADTFEPREVTLGIRDGDFYEIARGDLDAGDRVVAE
jgi:Cu(I)/Ag(I) efflux system membrane fusion protein